MKRVTRAQQAWRKVARDKPHVFMRKKLRIADLMGNEVEFRENWAQKRVREFIEGLQNTGKPARGWVGKWRRAGITSWSCADGYTYLYGNDNARVGVIAHLEDRAKEVLSNYGAFDQVIQSRHPDLWMEKSKDNIFGMKFDATNAQALIATAKNPIKVRGDGLHRLYGTEAAWWLAQFNLVMKEVCPVVPPMAGSLILLESTGSYMGSQPHLHWQEADQGQNEFVTLFLNWLEDPTLILPFPNDKARDALFELIQYTEPRLAELNAHYNLTPEKIAVSWQMYHYQSKNDFDNFCREFPYSKAMMWSTTGGSFFGVYEINCLTAVRPELIVVLEEKHMNTIWSDPSQLTVVTEVDDYSPRPNIKFWAPPVPGRRYVMGEDGSQGVPGGDYTYGTFIDSITREQMCAFHGLMRPDEAAHIMVSLGRYYNNAKLAPECNAQGGGTEALNVIERLGYTNIYEYRRRDHREGIISTNYLGWLTQYRTKGVMCGELRKMLHDAVRGRIADAGMFRDDALLREMRTFVLDPQTGELGGSNGCFDDRPIAISIAHQVAADEIFGTSQDPLVQYTRAQARKIIDPSKALVVPTSPAATMARFLNPNSPFNRNKFEI